MSLQDATSACHELLTNCCGLVALKQSGWAQCRLAELNLWSDSVGVFAQKNNALAHRLRLYPQVTGALLSSLYALYTVLEKCHKSCKQAHYTSESIETESCLAQDHDLDDVEAISGFENVDSDDNTGRVPPRSFSPWSDQDDLEDGSAKIPLNEPRTSPTPLEEHCRNAELILNQILDIGRLIRRSGDASRLSRADASFTHGSQHHLRQHLQIFLQRRNLMSNVLFSQRGHDLSSQDIVQIFGFGDSQRHYGSLPCPDSRLRTEQWQLVRANLIRRHRFEFFRKRAARLSRPETRDTSDRPARRDFRGNVASTTINKRQPETSTDGPTLETGNHDKQDYVSTTPSLVSVGQTSASTINPALLSLDVAGDQARPKVETPNYAPSTQMTQTGMQQCYPKPPPKSSLGRATFSCPCCYGPFTYSKAESKTSWRQHLKNDLHPYSCPVPDCVSSEILFLGKAEWESHLSEAHETILSWTCLMCESSDKFVDYNLLLSHLQQEHGEVIEERYLSSVADMCSQKTLDLPTSCPVCNLPKGQNSRAFVDHLAECILEFSLLALPFARLRYVATSSDQQVHQIQSWIAETNTVGDDYSTEGSDVSLNTLEEYRQEDELARDLRHMMLYSKSRATQRTPSVSDHSAERHNYFDDTHDGQSNSSDDSMSRDDARLRFWRVRNIRSFEKEHAMKWLQEQEERQGRTRCQRFSLAADGERTLCATLTSHERPVPSYSSWRVDKDFMGLTPLCDPEDASVDIIAIAGFGRHALESFCSADSTAVWLRDFAPKDVARARFITYGYAPASGADEGDQGVHELAFKLLDELVTFRHRTHTQHRPLIFVCHSLGGVMLKEAMVISSKAVDSKTGALHGVFTQTYGIFLMGVPNFGLERLQLDTLFQEQPNKGLVRDLLLTSNGQGPQFLDYLTREFSSLQTQRESPIKILSYHETLGTPVVMGFDDGRYRLKGPPIVMVPKKSTEGMESAHHIEYSISHSDHWDLVRFEHPQDERYISLIEKLGIMAEEATQTQLKHRSYRANSVYANLYIRDFLNEQDSDQVEKHLPFAKDAPYDAVGRQYDPDCLPGTQVDILAEIRRWVDGEDRSCIFWLSGSPGTGKSTIARTVAHRYDVEGRLAASFFFSSHNGDCGHAGLFATSIARQLANSKALNISQPIREHLKQHTQIAKQTLQDQWSQLILRPLSEYEERDDPEVFLIVVDALDECEDEKDVGLLLRILPTIDQLTHIRLRILVTSRPETPIRHGFARMEAATHRDLVMHHVLSVSSDRDILMFFEHRFRMIAREFGLHSDWPGQQILVAMTQRAQGLFSWAAVACNIIEVEERFADRRIRELMQPPCSSSLVGPQSSLGHIYTAILRASVPATYDQDEEENAYTTLSLILGALVVLFETLSMNTLGHLVDLSEDAVCRTVDRLHSILDVPETPKGPLRLFHQSFRDFLLSSDGLIDPRLRVKEGDEHARLFERCIRVMCQTLREDLYHVGAPGTLYEEVPRDHVQHYFPPEVQYACLYWIPHTVRAVQAGKRSLDNGGIYRFLCEHVLHWMEAMSWLRKTSEAIEAMTLLETMVEGEGHTRLSALVSDAKRFVRYAKSGIEQAPLQTYVSATLFTPTTSNLRQCSGRSAYLTFLRTTPRTTRFWGAEMQTLEGHSSTVIAVQFSPDGKKLVSASQDRTLRLWDTATGASIHTLQGHLNGVTAVHFSSGGGKLASASRDTKVIIWDANTGVKQRTLDSHSGGVTAIQFSPDDNKLASLSDDRTLLVWDMNTGALLQTTEGYLGKDRVFISDQDVSGDGDSLSVKGEWIFHHDRKIIWLPPNQRPVAYTEDSAAPETLIVGSRVAVRCGSYRVSIWVTNHY